VGVTSGIAAFARDVAGVTGRVVVVTSRIVEVTSGIVTITSRTVEVTGGIVTITSGIAAAPRRIVETAVPPATPSGHFFIQIQLLLEVLYER
jgi:hypothetical protein